MLSAPNFRAQKPLPSSAQRASDLEASLSLLGPSLQSSVPLGTRQWGREAPWSMENFCPQQQSWAESWKCPCMGRLVPGSPWCEEEGKVHVSQPAWKSHRQSTGFPWEFNRVVQACQSVGPWELSWFMVSHLPLLLDMGPQHCSQRDRWLQDGARWGGLVHQGWAVP